MGDYSDIPVKMATKSAPAAAYGDKRQLVRDNMLAMDKRSNFYNPDQHSFNTMKMLMIAKKYNNRFRYNTARWRIIKLISN